MRLLYLLLPLIISLLLGAATTDCDPLTCPCCDEGDPYGICVCPGNEPVESIYVPLFNGG